MKRQMCAMLLGKFARGNIQTRRQDTDRLIILVQQRRFVAVEDELDALADKFFFEIRDGHARIQNDIVPPHFACD